MTEWVLVPREPTAKMVLAAFDAITNASGEGMIRARWRCMLDAAPAAPQQAEPVEIVPRVWREALRKLTFMARTSGGTPGPDEGLQTACAEAETLLSKPYNYPPAAPQQADAVAWMAFGGSIVHAVTRNAMDPIEAERFDVPLYLHPPAAEVQRLRDALDEIESETQDVSIQQIARKALEGK